MARILIVDDEESDRLLLRAVLENAGHQVSTAADGDEALREFREKGIEIVVTDLQMPHVHGLELIFLLRDFTPPPKVIAISATGADQLEMASALGAKATISKPIDGEAVLAAVSQVLDTTSKETKQGS